MENEKQLKIENQPKVEEVKTYTQEEVDKIIATKNQEIESKKEEYDKKMNSIDVYKSSMAVQTAFMNPVVWTQIRAMSKILFESHALPSYIQNEAQLVMIVQAGFEIGMTPIEGIHSLYLVNGSVNIWGKAVTKRLKVHGWKIQYIDETEKSCTAIVTKGNEKYSETYSYEMAEESGYTKTKDGYIKVGWKPGLNRKLKLRYGALSIIIKSYIPEVLGNVGEIQEIAEDIELESKEEQKNNTDHTVSINNSPVKISTLTEKLIQERAKKNQESSKTEAIEAEEIVETEAKA